MAKRWSFEEDYIVCKFCIENEYENIGRWFVEEVADRLAQAGFAPRSSIAISKRARDFLCLVRGWESPYAVEQVRAIHRILVDKDYGRHYQDLIAFIDEKRKSACCVGASVPEVFTEKTDTTMHMVHIAKERKFIDVLEDYIQSSGIKPKSRVYRDVGMSEDTFSQIRRGVYKTVSRENLYKICFGLRLNYDDAIKLIHSCGYELAGNSVLDCVVEYFLRKGPTIDSVNKEERKVDTGFKIVKTHERVCFIYDTFQIDADLIESNEKPLFWG